MPVLERDPWRLQYFEHVPCPEHVVIPTDDPDCWNFYPAHRWVYNKLEICRTQGLPHGPHGTAWWVNGIQLKLGLLGKVIGFSILAIQIGQIQNFDASQSQDLLRSLTTGLGVAQSRRDARREIGRHPDGLAEAFQRLQVGLLGQHPFVELGARGDAAFHQHLPKAMGHLLMQRGAGDGDDFCTHGVHFVCK